MLDLDEIRANLTAIADYAALAPGEIESQDHSAAIKATTRLIDGVPDMVLELEDLRLELQVAQDALEALSGSKLTNRYSTREARGEDAGPR